jgi:hypothetical protein
MAYSLQAVIAKTGVLGRNLPVQLNIVPLAGGVEMIPLGSAAQDFYRLQYLPLTAEDCCEVVELPASAVELCEALSKGCVVAYIEAEYFGGTGNQAHVIFENGRQAGAVVCAAGAINEALRLLGVRAQDGGEGAAGWLRARFRFPGVRRMSARDEFDAVGLGRYRDTDRWLGGTSDEA